MSHFIHSRAEVGLALLAMAASVGGSQTKLAEQLGVSVAFVNGVIKGRKAPSGKILKLLGYEKVVAYRKIARGES